MALIDIDDLPAPTSTVLRRRARAAGLPVRQYVSRELTALANRRAPIDGVVRFLADERPGYPTAEVDSAALALIETYDLPSETWSVFSSTIDDALLEIREAVADDPTLSLDMGAVAASIRYVRGL
ncbi:hypothetical protein [Nocardia sp. SSK8]|uniref:hypothetical protein n=1 Tax=Nocardia sp. SSK8 TaxID=3120154 RepID=UPI00300A2641